MGRVRHSEEMKQRIISAFEQCLMKNGVNSISIRDIAAAGEIPLGSVHYYFKNKNEILLAYFEDIMNSCFLTIHEWRMQLPQDISDFSVFFSHFVRLTYLCFQEDENTIRYSRYYALVLESPELLDYCRKRVRQYAQEIAAAIENTQLQSKDPMALADALVSLWDGISLYSELFADKEDKYALFDALAGSIVSKAGVETR